MESRDLELMRLALDLARESGRAGEVPVGAVVAIGDEVREGQELESTLVWVAGP